MDLVTLQIEKLVIVVILHENTVTSFARTVVSALQIKTLACNEILTLALFTPCVTQREM